MIYAKAGTKMTCEGGHHIATLKRDIECGTVANPAVFDWVAIEPPLPGAQVEPCPICGRHYVMMPPVSGAVRFHTPEGWLVPDETEA